jgi:large subunit ribosomal protein L29
MKNSEIIELTTNEIVERIDTESEKLTRMRLAHAVSPVENPIKIKDARRDIARLKTELHKRQSSENK